MGEALACAHRKGGLTHRAMNALLRKSICTRASPLALCAIFARRLRAALRSGVIFAA